MNKLLVSALGMSAVALLVSLISYGDIGSKADNARPVSGEKEAEEICHIGIELLCEVDTGSPGNNENKTRGGAMVETAWALQAQYPQMVTSIWVMTDHWARQQQELEREYAILALYLQSVDNAIEVADSINDFELLWEVRKLLLERVSETEGKIADQLDQSLTQLANDINEKGVEKVLLAENISTHISQLYSQVEALNDASGGLPTKIARRLQENKKEIDRWLNERVDDQYLSFKKLEKTISNGDTNDDTNNLSGKDAKGPFTNLLDEIVKLQEVQHSPSVSLWTDIVEEMNVAAVRTDQTETDYRVQELLAKLLQARMLRYNMWATTHLYEATLMGTTGLPMLGQIDTRLLTSVVAALYSRTEADLLSAITDPAEKQVLIRESLRVKPGSLERF